MKNTIMGSALFSVVPSIPILIILVMLMSVLGNYFPWLRLSVIGSSSYENVAANIAARSFGLLSYTDSGYNASIFISTMWAMSICILYEPLLVVFGKKSLDKGMTSLRRHNPVIYALLIDGIFIAMMGWFCAPYMTYWTEKPAQILSRCTPHCGDIRSPFKLARQKDGASFSYGDVISRRYVNWYAGCIHRQPVSITATSYGGNTMKKNETNKSDSYLNTTHRLGKISTVIAILLILMVPAVITLIYGKDIKFNYSKTLSAANTLRVNGMERGTDEGEVITTLAIGASSIVTTLILFLGMLFLGNLLVPVITGPELAPAFNNVTPALTGALAAPYFMKNKKLSIPTVAAAVLLYLILGYSFMSANYSYFMLGFITVSFLCYLGMYKLGFIKEEPKK